MEELVEVTVLIEGLMPYGGYTPVIAAVWETHAAGSIGRIGSPTQSNWRIGYVGNVVEGFHLRKKWPQTHSWEEQSSSEGLDPST